MTTHPASLDNMMGAWNTTDEAEKRALTEAALEHNVHFVDPNHNIIGREAFLAMVAETQAKFPGVAYGHASKVDIQNNFCRYHWAIKVDGKVVMRGFDVTEVNDGGKIVKVIGFFGELVRD